jgi:hypothetical protein
MQQKAPQMIPDEKIHLLAASFHRRELTLARIFYGKCQLCQNSSEGQGVFQDPSGRIEGVIALGSEEFGVSFQIKDAHSLFYYPFIQKGRIDIYRFTA